MEICWQDKVTSTEVLARANLPNMTAILCKRRLRWFGHVRRVDDSRTPKQILFGELAQGNRPRERPKLRYKETCKSSFTKCGIDFKTWEATANDRSCWKTAVNKGVARLMKEMTSTFETGRKRRKARSTQPSKGTILACKFCTRVCASNIGRITHKRSCSKKFV